MDFIVRDITQGDLDQCLQLVTDRFLYDEAHLHALRRAWSHLIASKSNFGGALADARKPSHVSFFAFVVFVDYEHAARYHACTSPGIGYRLVEEWDSGVHPFLDREHIAEANARGELNLVVMHHGVIVPDDIESRERVRAGAQDLAVANIRCWNLQSYTNEVFAQDPLRDGKAMGEALGFRVRGYGREQLRAAGIPPEKAPWLWLAQRQDAARPAPLPLEVLFHTFTPPRFGFDDCEQDILKLALDGLTDESIAEATNASLTTTKKRFRRIYEKVESVAGGSELLGEAPANGVRGVEVRRRLLNYLRSHPEELRPYRRAMMTA